MYYGKEIVRTKKEKNRQNILKKLLTLQIVCVIINKHLQTDEKSKV